MQKHLASVQGVVVHPYLNLIGHRFSIRLAVADYRKATIEAVELFARLDLLKTEVAPAEMGSQRHRRERVPEQGWNSNGSQEQHRWPYPTSLPLVLVQIRPCRIEALKASHYFYLAECSDGSLYAGTCMDVDEREAIHNASNGAKYTRSRLPVKIVYTEKFRTLSDARKREVEVKRWTRDRKQGLL